MPCFLFSLYTSVSFTNLHLFSAVIILAINWDYVCRHVPTLPCVLTGSINGSEKIILLFFFLFFFPSSLPPPHPFLSFFCKSLVIWFYWPGPSYAKTHPVFYEKKKKPGFLVPNEACRHFKIIRVTASKRKDSEWWNFVNIKEAFRRLLYILKHTFNSKSNIL